MTGWWKGKEPDLAIGFPLYRDMGARTVMQVPLSQLNTDYTAAVSLAHLCVAIAIAIF